MFGPECVTKETKLCLPKNFYMTKSSWHSSSALEALLGKGFILVKICVRTPPSSSHLHICRVSYTVYSSTL